MGRPLWLEVGSVVWSCCRNSPAQSSSGLSPTGLLTIFYSLIWDSPNLEGQVPVFMSPRNRVTLKYPPPPGHWVQFEFEFELYCDRWSFDQFVLASGPCEDHDQILNFLIWQLLSFFVMSFLSDDRTSLQFAVHSLNGPSRSEPVTIFYCLIWGSPNLESQVPAFISHRKSLAQLYPKALGPLFVASYGS
jgi:hypothetical protein